jgi:undecaprenyl-diphosphatase
MWKQVQTYSGYATRTGTRALRWVFAQELIVLAVALLIVGAIWGFAVLADEVVEGATHRFDLRVLESLRHKDDLDRAVGPAWLPEAAADITALGGTTVTTLITLAVIGFLLMRRLYHAVWLVVIAAVGGGVLTSGIKHIIARPRPPESLRLDMVTSASFPSGHSLVSAVIYLTLAALLTRLVDRTRLKAYILTVAILAVVLIGLSRVYLGVHYPTDVLAGWTLGLAWALLCWLVARYLQRRGAVEPPAPEATDPRELAQS